MSEVSKGNPKIEQERFHFKESYWQDYVAIIPQGISPEDLESSDYWSIVAFKCRAGGHIWAECEDGTWEALCKIRNVGPTWVSVKLMQVYRYEPEEEPEADKDYEVFWRGQHYQFAIRRISDGAVIKNGLYPKHVALQALVEHRKAMAA